MHQQAAVLDPLPADCIHWGVDWLAYYLGRDSWQVSALKQQPGPKHPQLGAPQVDVTQVPLVEAAKLSIDPASAGRGDACPQQPVILQETAVTESVWLCLNGMLRCAADAQHGCLGQTWAQDWK